MLVVAALLFFLEVCRRKWYDCFGIVYFKQLKAACTERMRCGKDPSMFRYGNITRTEVECCNNFKSGFARCGGLCFTGRRDE